MVNTDVLAKPGFYHHRRSANWIDDRPILHIPPPLDAPRAMPFYDGQPMTLQRPVAASGTAGAISGQPGFATDNPMVPGAAGLPRVTYQSNVKNPGALPAAALLPDATSVGVHGKMQSPVYPAGGRRFSPPAQAAARAASPIKQTPTLGYQPAGTVGSGSHLEASTSLHGVLTTGGPSALRHHLMQATFTTATVRRD
jgi:hypothetical protein